MYGVVTIPCGYVNCYSVLSVRLRLLNVTLFQADLFSASLFNLLHPDDVDKVRNQLSTTEALNAGRILDLKSKLFFSACLFVYSKYFIFMFIVYLADNVWHVGTFFVYVRFMGITVFPRMPV